MKLVSILGVNIKKGYSAINKRKKILFKKRYDLRKNDKCGVWIDSCFLDSCNTIKVHASGGNIIIDFNGNELSRGVINTMGRVLMYNYNTKSKINLCKL